MNLEQHVLKYRDALITSLQENIRIPSVEGPALPDAPYGEGVRNSLHHALETARKLGFRTCNMDNHIGWAEFGEGEEMIGILGHLDVVPEGDGWTYPPYGGEIHDGKLFGRGTIDDKGPSIAALYAMAALRDSGLPLRRRVRVILGCNEETGSGDIRHYLQHGGELPVMGFTPDAEYPVINGEKGIITTIYKTDFVQDGDLILTEIHGGTASNVVPHYAYAKFKCDASFARSISLIGDSKVKLTATEDGFLLEAFGESAHGSTPELGENAIGRLLIAMANLPLCPELLEKVRFLADKIGMECDGTSAGIGLQDEPSGKLSLNLGTIEADEKSITLCINYRYPVTCSYDACAPVFNSLMADNGFGILREFHKEQLYIPADSQLVKTLVGIYSRHTGGTEPAKCIGGGTYAKSMPNMVAFGPVFPGDILCEHKADEHITLDNLMRNACIIASAMYELAK